MPKIHIDTYDFQYLKKSTIGERLKFFRHHIMQYSHNSDDFTITALGSRLEVSPQTISSIERGSSKNPSFLLVHKLTKEYGVPLESVTDEFYMNEERLFAIGKPDEPIVIDDEDFIIDDKEEYSVVIDDEKDEDETFFDFDETNGILLYNSLGKNEFVPLYHVHLKKDISNAEVEHLISRLLFETADLSIKKLDRSKAVHPLQEANQIINRHNKLLSADELLRLLTNTNYTK
ncbi:helix-turn-helix transcriptional regulator [Oceanobacillus oncorhynchi]|uniref:helix-turn-helix transcriptional regulator n=1 Tax=Oceanobacillus oncorhynchi TaxID=545501 RepID=UPI0025A46639|nr:helix-turn-helix transcriptional regulator [Oceanobacillus oncorhynchi]MDM8101348.1 helix-turn-helix transcriptional regulator [Oceanobacillus oncorhynchi]